MGSEMPDTIRHFVRAGQHPARAVPCPHCLAHAHRPCTSPSKRRVMAEPHPRRIAAWVTTIACCPFCQVEAGIPCHLDGWPLRDGGVHPARSAVAEVTAA